MTKLFIVKIGGNIIDDDEALKKFLKSFAFLFANGDKLILVHGGGKLATKLATTMGIEQQLVDGRRITDAETLKIVTMVYAGFINKNIVAALQSCDCNAIGLTGADGNAILAHKRKHASIDYGYVGDIDRINVDLIDKLLQANMAIVFAPLTHNGEGQLLNTNADTIAQEIATAMSRLYAVELIYSFEKVGVLTDADDENTVIPVLNKSLYENLKHEQKIFAGMIPKLDNAFTALNNGVSKVIIGKADSLDHLINGKSGTTIVNE